MASSQNTAQTQSDREYKMFKGAKVLWPPDCSDDILDETIKETHMILKSCNIKTEGKKVILYFLLSLPVSS